MSVRDHLTQCFVLNCRDHIPPPVKGPQGYGIARQCRECVWSEVWSSIAIARIAVATMLNVPPTTSMIKYKLVFVNSHAQNQPVESEEGTDRCNAIVNGVSDDE
ncbi:hypothetical protein KC322_g24 [Hortaea werneckii]|nr:hypothetical protein KC322_g24 [Hortaea werneckii]